MGNSVLFSSRVPTEKAGEPRACRHGTKGRRINCCRVYWGTMHRSRSPTGLRAVVTKVSQATGQPSARSSLAARLIHPWGEPMGVCTWKSATIIVWRILSVPPVIGRPISHPSIRSAA